MRVAVTGSTGALGSRVVARLGDRAIPIARATHGDVTEASAGWFEGADAVVHAAAKLPQQAPPVEVWRSVVAGTSAVARACVDAGVRSLLLVSSAAVYGTTRARPVREDDEPLPVRPYGWAKLAAESLLAPYEGEMRISIARVFNVYGGGTVSVVDKVLADIAAGRAPRIAGSEASVRDFIHVDEAARALVHLAGREGIWNVGTGAGRTIAEVAALALKARGLTDAPSQPPLADAGKDADFSVADITALRAAGFTPADRLAEHLRAPDVQMKD